MAGLACCVVLVLAGASDCGSGDSKAKSSPSSKVSASANSEADRCATYYGTLKRYAKKSRKAKDLNLQNKYAADMYRDFAEVFPSLAVDLRRLASLYDQAYEGTMSKAEERQLSLLDQRTADSIAKYCPGG